MQYAVFRKRDSADYPDPFDRTIVPTRERAEAYLRSNYNESAWKWLEVRERPAPAAWKKCADD